MKDDATVYARCPHCGAVGRGPASYLQRDLKCPKCGRTGRFVEVKTGQRHSDVTAADRPKALAPPLEAPTTGPVKQMLVDIHPNPWLSPRTLPVLATLFLLGSVLLLISPAWGVLILLAGALVWWYRRNVERLLVTPDRVIYERGLLAKFAADAEITQVRDFRIKSTALEAFFGYGTLTVSMPGSADVKIQIGPIRHPQEVVRRIQELQSDASVR